jgi:hypothetical protein
MIKVWRIGAELMCLSQALGGLLLLLLRLLPCHRLWWRLYARPIEPGLAYMFNTHIQAQTRNKHALKRNPCKHPTRNTPGWMRIIGEDVPEKPDACMLEAPQHNRATGYKGTCDIRYQKHALCV